MNLNLVEFQSGVHSPLGRGAVVLERKELGTDLNFKCLVEVELLPGDSFILVRRCVEDEHSALKFLTV